MKRRRTAPALPAPIGIAGYGVRRADPPGSIAVGTTSPEPGPPIFPDGDRSLFNAGGFSVTLRRNGSGRQIPVGLPDRGVVLAAVRHLRDDVRRRPGGRTTRPGDDHRAKGAAMTPGAGGGASP